MGEFTQGVDGDAVLFDGEKLPIEMIVDLLRKGVADAKRIDWLGSLDQDIAVVMLPTAIVEQTLVFRDSIDLAMRLDLSNDEVKGEGVSGG